MLCFQFKCSQGLLAYIEELPAPQDHIPDTSDFLLNADGNAIEGAEEEVKLLLLEKEEAAGRGGGTPGGIPGQGL